MIDSGGRRLAMIVGALLLSAGSAGARPPASAGEPMCETAPPIFDTGSAWPSAGLDAGSTRFQPRPGFSVGEVPRLKLKWAFAMAGGGMPSVVGDWLFTTNRQGRFYALNARTGCVRWVRTDIVARTTPAVVRSPLSPSGWAVIVGQHDRRVRAFDAESGQELWRSAVLEDHPQASMTGAPTVSGNRVFAPITSGEEGAAARPDYRCCSFRGALAALDLTTGATLWKTYTVSEAPHPIGVSPAGTPMQGPAGGAIWSSPTTDPARGLVYVATGDSYTGAPNPGFDAVIALDMETGRVRWTRQVTLNDNFITGCAQGNPPPNCPNPAGHDYDFGASPILMKSSDGREILLAGQKSGLVYGLDPDTGRVEWTRRIGAGSEQGGVQWGMAADGRRLYVANSDLVRLARETQVARGVKPTADRSSRAEPSVTALDPASGRVLWRTPVPVAPCRLGAGRKRGPAGDACLRAPSAAISAMPGVVFSGTTDGWLRAYDSATGGVIWAYSTTAQAYETVNGVHGQPGGSLNGMGPTVAGGMVYVLSGYTYDPTPNVLLAFSVDGQ